MMTGKEKISIALCTYNGGKYLRAQLDSIVQQTLLPVEIVVCDDASTDDTVTVLEKFASKSPLPVHIHINEKKLGIVGNFRKAISLCKGDYIALSDQDDVWLKDKLEKEISIYNQPGNQDIQVVFSDLLLVDENGKSLGKTMWQHLNFNKKLQKKWKDGKALEILTKYGNLVTGSTVMFKASFRPFIDEMLKRPGRIWIHDGLIALTAARKNVISFINEATVLYRQHPGQVIGGSRELHVPVQMRLKKLWSRRLNVVSEIDTRLESYKKHKADLTDLGFGEQDLRHLDPLIDHLQVRRNLPRNRIKRIPMIVKEWIKLRYFKYSGSLIMQAIKDWLVKRTLILS